MRSRRAFLLPLLLAVGLATASPEPQALAAPQGLALLPSLEPIPLHCDEHDCHAELASICLQRDRTIPAFGQPYRVIAGEPMLLATSGTGEVTRLRAAGLASFTAHDGYTAVRVGFARTTLAALGAGSLAFDPGPGTVLAPAESGRRADDANPQRAEDLAFLAGPARAAAQAFFAREATRIAAAQLVGRGIAALPEHGHGLDYDARAVWERELSAAAARTDPAALGLARSAARFCSGITIRTCLGRSQRQLLQPLNRDYWDQLFGS